MVTVTDLEKRLAIEMKSFLKGMKSSEIGGTVSRSFIPYSRSFVDTCLESRVMNWI